DGTTVTTTKTDAAGKYLFADLEVLPGEAKYKVSVTAPANYEPTTAGVGSDKEKDSSTGSETAKALPNDGDKDLSLDFGFVKKPVAVDIEKYDGTWDGVTFQGENAELVDGQPKVLPVGDRDTAGEALVVKASETTAVKFTVTNTGRGELNNVIVSDQSLAGPALTELKCTVEGSEHAANGEGKVVLPADWVFAPKASFECAAVLPALGQVKLHSDKAMVEASPVAGGDKVTDSDEWHAKPRPKVWVGDYVWFDKDKDGMQDEGEVGIKDVTLSLTGPDGKEVVDVFDNPVAPVKTDKDGKYVFENLPTLPAGQHYTVTITAPQGYLPTKEGVNKGSGALDSSTGSSVSVADLSTDEANDPTLDFGFIKPSVTVGDYVFQDNNDNGIQDDGDKPIAGVELKLTGPDGKQVIDVNGNPVGPVKTGKDGKYLFPNLPVLQDGQHYTVTVTPPAGYQPAKTGQGNRENDSSTGSASSLTLTKDGQKDLSLDFGFIKPKPTTPKSGKGGKLAKTGSDALGIAPYAIGLLAAGGGLLFLRRKKN
ncbi:MAG: SdrD B-like domain-containing protein, partial [Buchananella hordeovulneris]|nr:SdrD B-like domain-containing protein [Buchananella hordeovulneris]